jgi:hypothetical protein
MRWNSQTAATVGPDEADGKKLHDLCKRVIAGKAKVEDVRMLLFDIGQSSQLAELCVAAVRAYDECKLAEQAADGCRSNKIAADQLLGVLRRTNPNGLKEAEQFAAKMEQCEREASSATQKLEGARVASIYRAGLEERFGYLFGRPCRLTDNATPPSVFNEFVRLGIPDNGYPWTLPELEFQKSMREAPVVSAAERMRNDAMQEGLVGLPGDSQAGNSGYFQNSNRATAKGGK